MLTTQELTTADYDTIVNAVTNKFESIVDNFKSPDPRDGRDHHIIGCIVRFVGHDFMDYRTAANNPDGSGKERGGSDACMDLDDDDNNGLRDCVKEFGFVEVYE